MMKNESGRSMVEMLGVLAIIGVLSIGGIAGYTLAMNRYRANEIMDAASKVAIVAMSAKGGAGDSATLANIGSPKIPLVTGDANISSTNQGLVTINLDTPSDTVVNTIKSIAGSRASATSNKALTIDFRNQVE